MPILSRPPIKVFSSFCASPFGIATVPNCFMEFHAFPYFMALSILPRGKTSGLASLIISVIFSLISLLVLGLMPLRTAESTRFYWVLKSFQLPPNASTVFSTKSSSERKPISKTALTGSP
jgi:hypothetical protein